MNGARAHRRCGRLIGIAGMAMVAMCGVASAARAQTIYNVPPDTAPPTIDGTDVVNILDGGTLTGLFEAFGQGQVNLFPGGTLTSGGGSKVFYDTSSFVATGGTLIGTIVRLRGESVGVIHDLITPPPNSGVDNSPGSFVAEAGSHLTINGGLFYGIVQAAGGTVTVNGGYLPRSTSSNGGTFRVLGGTVDGFFNVGTGARAIVDGGTVLGLIGAQDDAVVDLISGHFGGSTMDSPPPQVAVAIEEATINLRGGTFTQDYDFSIQDTATMTVFGTGFALDGVPIDLGGAGTEANPYVLLEREGQLLTAILADGSAFGTQLTANRYEVTSTLQLVVVPEPSASALLGLAGLAALRRRRHGVA